MAETGNSGTKITVYWLDKSRAQRIIWLLEELSLSYDIKVFYRGSDMLAPKELKEIHPLGKLPVIGIQTPEMEKELIIAESGTIVEYLSEHFGNLIPKRYPEGKEGRLGAETPEYMRYKHFIHYAEGSLMLILVVGLVVSKIKDAPVPFFIKPITGGISSKINSAFVGPNTKTHFEFCEQQLTDSPGGGPYFCGNELTGADIQMLFPIEAGQASGAITKDKHPHLYVWLDAVHAREAYKRGTARIEELTGKPFQATTREG